METFCPEHRNLALEEVSEGLNSVETIPPFVAGVDLGRVSEGLNSVETEVSVV